MSKGKNYKPASVCLYGNGETGAGWLVGDTGGPMLGTGEPVKGRSNTEAVWQAVDALRAAGYQGKAVRVYAPGGRIVATVDLTRAVGYFGDFKWEPAEVYVVSVEELERVAAEQAAAGG